MNGYPGTVWSTIGGKVKAITQGPTTERLVIIGTAVDGPLNKPMPITDVSQAEQIFGPLTYSKGYKDPNTGTESGETNGASLPLAIAQALTAGCGDIWAVRATGSFAANASGFSNKLSFKALYPGRIYNDVSFTGAVSGSLWVFTVNLPSVKGNSYTTSFSSGLNVGEVIDRINSDPRNNCFYINPDVYPTYLTSACTTLGSGTVTMTGGTYGTVAKGEDYATSKAGYATMLAAGDTSTFYSLIGQGFTFDMAVLADIYFNDQVVDAGDTTGTTIATDFTLFLEAVSQQLSPCRGVMSVRPCGIRDEASLIDYIQNNLLSTSTGAWNATLKWNKAGGFMYNGFLRTDPSGTGVIDMGRRLQVCAGPEVVMSHPTLGRYSGMWHVLYAAKLTTLPPEVAPIYTQLDGILTHGTIFPRKYCNKLAEGVGFVENVSSGKGGYVTLTRTPRNPQGPLVILDDTTATDRADYFAKDQLMHLTNSIENHVDLVLSPFLGKSVDPGHLAAMEAAVQNVLDGFGDSGALMGRKGEGYNFQITMTGQDRLIGAIRVYIEIFPSTALRKIIITVAVKQVS